MKHCLVVDDDQMSRTMLANFVSQFARCDIAPDGRHGLELFEHSLRNARPYEVVFLDLAMPVMNGHVLIRKIRELESRQPAGYLPTKIFVISFSSSPWDMAETVLDKIADDYMVKPFSRAKLVQLLIKHGLDDCRGQAEAVAG
jgi:CheY-like chemotaxis protein